jgi:PAS domain S-box-containing protein
MEKQNSSPHPGGGNLSDWIAKPYSIVFTAVILFVFIFGIAVFLGWRQFNDTRNNVLASDKTIANLLADVILQHNRTTIGILQSYAHRPLFIAALEKKDLAGVDRHLSDLKKNADIDTTFVADKTGILLTNLPVFPESRGKDFSQRDWYKGISAHWKPYISAVYKRIAGDKPLTVAVCVPIFDKKERPIGILGNSQRLNYIEDTIEKVPFNPYTAVNVIDQGGKILYSNRYSYRETIAEYPHLPMLDRAMKDMRQQIEDTHHKDLGELYLTVVPIGDIGWTAVIERSLRDMYYSALRGFIEIGAISFLLFLMITFFLIYLKKVTLFRKTEELLQAEKKLRQRDEKLRALSSRQEAILAAVPAIIMEVDNSKIYTWANSVGLNFFGEDVIGKEAAFYFEGEQDTYETVRHLFNGGEEIIYVESWQRRRDGQKRLLAWWCRVLKDEKGNVGGALSSAYDITERKHAEEKLQDTLESLRKAVGTTIQVLTTAVETRDPYTAGHQVRSADLARAIGTEMGLPQDKIDAIRIAGSIHDIGKLSIPAEILSKPNKLSDIEFSLIKEHARKGFEMLKDVESPWPLAEIVHQHHERKDGSGYPRNLKGEAILIEARILAVADVVEAIASHRPYRPGLGIDAALNEIEKNRGIFYDADVADACLRLFREKGFQLQEA